MAQVSVTFIPEDGMPVPPTSISLNLTAETISGDLMELLHMLGTIRLLGYSVRVDIREKTQWTTKPSEKHGGMPCSTPQTPKPQPAGSPPKASTRLTTWSSTEDGVTIQFQLGRSGKRDLEHDWLRCMVDTFETFVAKQADYGSDNIARHGARGLVVRMDDKIARLANLLATGRVPANESITDTFLDIADYGIIGMIVQKGRWY